MINESLSAMHEALMAKKISSVELTQLFLDRIHQLNPTINAFITICADRAIEDAKKADAKIAAGEKHPLLGIPLAHKDLFCTKDILTTCASKMLANFTSPYDGHVVEKLANAGITLLGKTNLDEFAMGSTNETSYYGPVLNPWNNALVAGGSSGGSAAAVAARMVPIATASDTGGSIRQPAAFCGITGIKPTYGLVSRYGIAAFASSLDQGGAMAKSAHDCAFLLQTMIGFDERDETSLNRPEEDLIANIEKPLNGLKIGIVDEFFDKGLSPEVEEKVKEAIKWYENQGATCVPISLPHTKAAIATYYVIAPAEASSNMARFDGVRYGYRAPEYTDLWDMYAKTRAQGFGEEVKRRILIGTYVLSHGYYDAYYVHAQKIRRLIAEDFKKAFEACDVIMGPVSPTTALPLNANQTDPTQNYLTDVYTVSTNMAGLPAMSIPCGFGNHSGAPVGLHLIGNYFSEAKLLNIAHRYQMETNWHLNMPATL